VMGETYSTDFPTLNPYQEMHQGFIDIFVTKLNPDNSFAYSTYLGGNGEDISGGIVVDVFGVAYVTGYTYSTTFPTLNPYQEDQGSLDAFVSKLSSSGNSLIYSTYLGGSSSDGGSDIAIDTSGDVYIAGYTGSTDFPTLNPYQETHQGNADIFITKFFEPCCALRGDVAEPKDGIVLVNDLVCLVDYLFKGGAAPACLDEGDCAVPLDDLILVNDLVWLVDYLFKGGQAPPDC